MSSVLKPLFWSQSDILFLSLFFHFCWTCSLLFTKDSILSLLFPLTSFFPQLLFFKDTFMLFYYYFLIWPHCTSCRILVPPPGTEPGAQPWKCQVLTGGQPENSLQLLTKSLFCVRYRLWRCLLPRRSLLSGAGMFSKFHTVYLP